MIKLLIKSEVMCKFEGLPIELCKSLVKKFKYMLPGAQYMPLVKLGRWDGCKEFFTASGLTYIHMLPMIIEYMEIQKKIDISQLELIDLRKEKIDYKFDLIDENYLSSFLWGEGHSSIGTPIQLRDYQVSAINYFIQNTQSVQVLATGSGKTIISAALSLMVDKYGKSIIIVPNKDLVQQTYRYYKYLNLDVGVFYGDKKEYSHRHTICTWQSLNSAVKTAPSIIAEIKDGLHCMMVDECFSPDSMVLTVNGYIQISEIKVGDKIINYSSHHNQFKVDSVVKIHKNLISSMNCSMLLLTFSNGETINVTENHEFLTKNRGWVCAKDLSEFDTIISVTCMNLIYKNVTTCVPEVYNLHIQDDHNYIVDGAVVKNCHTAKATVLLELLTNEFGNIPIRWGFTGTIPKDIFASESIRVSIGNTTNVLSAAELQEKNVLSDCMIHVKQLIDYRTHGTWPAELEYLIENRSRIEYISGMISAIAKTGNTLVLVDRRNSGNMLTSMIETSIFLNGSSKVSVRKDRYNEVALSSDNILICTYGIAAVGIDVPDLYNLVLIEPGKSFVRVIQSIGRGLRRGKIKDFINIYDITSTCKFSKRHLSERKKYYKEAKYNYNVEKLDWQQVGK